MIQYFENGPFLSALGWTGNIDYAVQSRPSNAWGELERTMTFPANGIPRSTQIVDVQRQSQPLKSAMLKRSGVPRARSAAKATVFTAFLGRELAGYLETESSDARGECTGFDGNRVSLSVVTASSIVSIFWAFESVGLSQSWDRTDTMLLPASIPSSTATALSNVVDCHASAINHAGGAAGAFAAVEHAHLNFVHGRSDKAMVICAEEVSTQLVEGMERVGINRDPMDGASGLVLSSSMRRKSDWQITFSQWLCAEQPEADPMWQSAMHLVIEFGDDYPVYTSTTVPQGIHRVIELALKAGRTNAILEVRNGAGSRYAMGLRHASAMAR